MLACLKNPKFGEEGNSPIHQVLRIFTHLLITETESPKLTSNTFQMGAVQEKVIEQFNEKTLSKTAK